MNHPRWAIVAKSDPEYQAKIAQYRGPISRQGAASGMSFGTGTGDNGTVEPSKPTHMLQTNNGPRMLHEDETVNIGPRGRFQVIPSEQTGGQDNLEKIENGEAPVPGYKCGRRIQGYMGGKMKGYQAGTLDDGPPVGGMSSLQSEATIPGGTIQGANNVSTEYPQPYTGTDPSGSVGPGGTYNILDSQYAQLTPNDWASLPQDKKNYAIEKGLAPSHAYGGPVSGPQDDGGVVSGGGNATIQGGGGVVADDTTTTTTGARGTIQGALPGQGLSAEAATTMGGIMRGDSEILRNIANTAFQQLDPRLQNSMSLTAMRIANDPNITQGGKATAMASALRDAGVAQGNLAADMASKAMDMAMQATSQAFTMGMQQSKFAQERQEYGTAQDWLEYDKLLGMMDYDGAADVFERITGKRPSVEELKEDRAYQTTKQGQDVTKGALEIDGIRLKLGNETVNSIVNAIKSGFGYDYVSEKYKGVTKEMFDSIETEANKEFTESKRRFDAEMGLKTDYYKLDMEKFWLDEKKWGADVAYRNQVFDYNNATNAINAAIAAGDFKGATAISAALGWNIDYTKVADEADQAVFADSMGMVQGLITQKPGQDWLAVLQDPAVRDYLNKAYKTTGGEPGGLEEWAKNTLTGMILANDPMYASIHSMSDTTMTNFMTTSVGTKPDGSLKDGWTIDDYEYAGQKGLPAARLAVTNLFIGGGIVFDAQGHPMSVGDNPAWQLFTGETPKAPKDVPATGTTGAAAGPEGVPNEEYTGLYSGDDFSGKALNETVVTADGKYVKIGTTGLDSDWAEVQYNPGTEATTLGYGGASYLDATTGQYVEPAVGSIVKFETPVSSGPTDFGYTLPAGTYKVITAADVLKSIPEADREAFRLYIGLTNEWYYDPIHNKAFPAGTTTPNRIGTGGGEYEEAFGWSMTGKQVIQGLMSKFPKGLTVSVK